MRASAAAILLRCDAADALIERVALGVGNQILDEKGRAGEWAVPRRPGLRAGPLETSMDYRVR